jgi:hypothetical protein
MAVKWKCVTAGRLTVNSPLRATAVGLEHVGKWSVHLTTAEVNKADTDPGADMEITLERILAGCFLLWIPASAVNAPSSLMVDHESSIAAVTPNADLPVWSWGHMVRVQHSGTAAPVVSSFDERGS